MAEKHRDTQNLYYEICGPEGEEPFPYRPPSYSRHAYSRPDLEGNFFPAHHIQFHSSADSYHGPAPSHPSHQHHHLSLAEAASFPASHGNPCHPQQASFVARPPLSRGSEMHPLPASCFSPLAPPPAAASSASRTFVSSPRKGRHLPPSSSSSSSHPAGQHSQHPAPLHPYFENGRVCYRDQPEEDVHAPPPPADAHLHKGRRPAPQARRRSSQRQYNPPAEPGQPVYVNYPFSLSASTVLSPPPPPPLPPPPPPSSSSSSLALPASQGWANTDLDSPHEQRSPLTSPGESHSSPSSLQSSPEMTLTPAGKRDQADDGNDPVTKGGEYRAPCVTKHSWSEEEEEEEEEEQQQEAAGVVIRRDSNPLLGQNIAVLLMAKMAEEEGNDAESPSHVAAPCPAPAQLKGPPYHAYGPPPPQPPPYSTAMFRCSSFQQAGDPRRVSSGGGGRSQYYHQAHDMLPPPDPSLPRFHRTPVLPMASRLNTRTRSCHNPLYPSQRASHPLQQQPPPAALLGLPGSDAGPRLPPNHHHHHQPHLHQAQNSAPGESVPDTSALRGVVGQNGVSGAKWSQTRSYC